MEINTSTLKKFKTSLKKYYEKKILPTTVKGPVVHYVFNFCDPAKNYYIEVTSSNELHYILLFKIANGDFCDDLHTQITENDEQLESIEDLNAEMEKLLENDILCNLNVIKFLKI